MTPKAKPIPNTNIMMGPRPGCVNHLVTLNSSKKTAVAVPEIAKMAKTRCLVPLMIAAQKIPAKTEAEIIQSGAIFPFSKKLLKLIARYSFKRTATQKIGKEYIKKAMKVIP